MKNVSCRSALILMLVIGWLGQSKMLAQRRSQYLALKGVGVSVAGSTYPIGTDVQVVGNHAYLAWRDENSTNQGGLEVFEVSNPANPIRVGGYNSGAHVNAVRIASHYAYLAEGNRLSMLNDPGAFEIIDVSDPTHPVRAGGANTRGRANGLHVAGNFAYVPESTQWTGSNYLGVLEVFDVTTPSNLLHVATYVTEGSATSVDVAGGHAYVADGASDLLVLDVSDPTNPTRVGGYDTDEWDECCGSDNGGVALKIQVVENLVYSAGQDGLHILDMSDPAKPVRLGGSYAVHMEDAFCVEGDYAYAAYYSSTYNGVFLRVLDVSDPTNPVDTAGDWIGGFTSVQVVAGRIYVAGQDLLIYEFKEPPVIKFSRGDGMLFLSWEDTPGFILQRATSLDNADWDTVPMSERQTCIGLPMGNGSEFFRLIKL